MWLRAWVAGCPGGPPEGWYWICLDHSNGSLWKYNGGDFRYPWIVREWDGERWHTYLSDYHGRRSGLHVEVPPEVKATVLMGAQV